MRSQKRALMWSFLCLISFKIMKHSNAESILSHSLSLSIITLTLYLRSKQIISKYNYELK